MSLRLALIGHPVKHSLSPPMHRAAFLFFGLDGSYDLIDIEEVGDNGEAFESLVEQGLSGWNVTVPHKEATYRWIKQRSGKASSEQSPHHQRAAYNASSAHLSQEAELAGAVNSVRVTSSGEVYGHNTDIGGFTLALEQLIDTLGAGSLPAPTSPQAPTMSKSRADGECIRGAGSRSAPTSTNVPTVSESRSDCIRGAGSLPAPTSPHAPTMSESRSDGNAKQRERKRVADFSAAALLGAGGAARAVICALALSGVSTILIVARRLEKAEALCVDLSTKLAAAQVPVALKAVALDAYPEAVPPVVVNCTPIGLTEKNVPDSIASLITRIPKYGVFYDTVYAKDSPETLLCMCAREAGLHAADGRTMLIAQAELAFEFWTSRRPPEGLYSQALAQALSRSQQA